MPAEVHGSCPNCNSPMTISFTVTGGNDNGSSSPSSDGRPACKVCGHPGALLEGVAQRPPNRGRRFRGWKCVNQDCDNHDNDFIRFQWL